MISGRQRCLKRGEWKMFLKRAAGLMLVMLMCLCASAMAQGAVVDNGSDPSSRLNMRSAPARDAAAVGKFVSGTHVEILEDAGGGWSKVQIGGGRHVLTGYMMTQYLNASSAVDARESRKVASPYGTPAVVLRNRPSNSYDAVMMLPVGESVTVIGVSGDFCFVLAADGSAGCLLDSELK